MVVQGDLYGSSRAGLGRHGKAKVMLELHWCLGWASSCLRHLTITFSTVAVLQPPLGTSTYQVGTLLPSYQPASLPG